MKNIYFTIIIILFLFSCSEENKFKKNNSGLEYFFIKKVKKSKKPKIGDILIMNLKYSTEKDSILQDSKNLKMQFKKPSYENASIEEAISLMKVGEKAKFKIDANNFYEITKNRELPSFLKVGDILIFEIELIGFQTFEEFSEERRIAYHSNKKEENKILNDYLKRTNVTVKPTKSGLYYIETKKGKGKKAEKGDIIIAHYIGSFIDGKIFDSSYSRKKKFKFVLGNSQFIPALEEAFLKTHEGTTAKLIIPSEIAYGENGLKNFIPPFASLIFEIEVFKIIKK